MNMLERRLVELNEALLNLNYGTHPTDELIKKAKQILSGGTIAADDINETVIINQVVEENKTQSGTKGDKGDKGDRGEKGDKGENGTPGVDGENSNPISYGSWIPELISSGNGKITLNVKNATFSQIGQIINCTFDIVIDTIESGKKTDFITLSGLPITSISGDGYVGNIHISYFSNMAVPCVSLYGNIMGESTNSSLWISKTPAINLLKLTHHDIQKNTRISGSIQYLST